MAMLVLEFGTFQDLGKSTRKHDREASSSEIHLSVSLNEIATFIGPCV